MGLVFGITSAVLLGFGDLMAARAARRAPSVTVTRTVVVMSCVVAPLLLVPIEATWTVRDSVIGGLSGLAMISGLLLLYQGYGVARMGIVAPTSSVLIAAVPVLIDLLRGVRPGTLGAVGIALGLAALVLTSYTPGGEGSAALGAALGLTSGVLFGLAFTLMGEVSPDAGLSPVVVQRFAGLALISVVAFLRRHEPYLAPPGAARRYALTGGIIAVLAIGALQLGYRTADTGPVSVAASQFATVAVILAVVVNRERLRWWQASGVAATAVGVALMAVG